MRSSLDLAEFLGLASESAAINPRSFTNSQRHGAAPRVPSGVGPTMVPMPGAIGLP
jgi:hypothetical protein